MAVAGIPLKQLIRESVLKLQEAGIADAKTDTFLLLEAAAGITKAGYLLDPDKQLSASEYELFDGFLKRRMQHEPCQYIIGQTEFYGLSFLVNEHVLIPRQDTELLVEEALKTTAEDSRVLDLCTGSGAVAVAIKHSRPDAAVTALDISKEALETAKKNAEKNGCGIEFLVSDLFEDLGAERKFDVIVSNPPYISETEYETLMPEVKDHEPSLALLAGEEGLDIYRRLIAEAPRYLAKGGALLVEIGCSQAEAVSRLFKENGFKEIKVIKDLAGLDRVVSGTTGR
ncbi:MAG: peptide chain release factor N(5)-glutamine methyltransferase [Lachnospiraceae bacterium]|nr:peptide chain release factor N(5)-glutamine methyltransferase [Lachnospiraceae bacterium]